MGEHTGLPDRVSLARSNRAHLHIRLRSVSCQEEGHEQGGAWTGGSCGPTAASPVPSGVVLPTPMESSQATRTSLTLVSMRIKNRNRLGRPREFRTSDFLWPATSCRRQSRGAARSGRTCWVLPKAPLQLRQCPRQARKQEPPPLPIAQIGHLQATNRQVSARARIGPGLAACREEGPGPWESPCAKREPLF